MIKSININGVSIIYSIANPKVDDIFVAAKTGATVKETAIAEGATVAANLNYAHTKDGIPIGRVIVNGKVVNGDIDKTIPREELYMLSDGSLHIGKAPKTAVWAKQGSPRLLLNGKNVVANSVIRDQLHPSIWANNAKHVRIAHGVTADNRLVIVRTLSKVTLNALTAIMSALGCVQALNGDGGGSAYLWPADNGSGRKMGATLCIKQGGKVKPMKELNIKENFIPKGRGNRTGYTMKPEYITIHETGNKAADAEDHAKYLKGDTAASKPVSWHYTVDDNETIQHLPTDESGWHAGDGASGPGNRKSIGIETCEHAGINQEVAWLNTAKLTAWLLFTLNLPLSAVVQHSKWSGKDCPQDLRKSGRWQWLLDNVTRELKLLDPLPEEKPPVSIVEGFNDINGHWAEKAIVKAKRAGVMNGVTSDRFAPDEPLTRAQTATLLDRLGLLREGVK
ncbi:N-acetylmuramoyl-L-alanine amidase [Paenibacillus sp. L3-i20]|uniref:N-acetylmuramoyl-L-alanine amidase n=1 Tax=Paenibacillus sp. L3-i20 TaxID=2905833 RepID=UPI001EDF2897|nr:N-acetylmuramoyl-L-alanine amidase [Paenibacillus sp. L3-i20]GKU79844.1 hypothetical protein L3i20_v242410 [Paenibacillus sp. L3-i20]